ncbi:hypothetical protein SCHPADRAFT_379833 [Schizopora paradoxa]|uniref:Uncharacterized protein n=1 Tax=Schizopora paradoxa TaxID=27342 RepID=A0A0H2RNF9_9AGAM|nr:hypothetical protein SCHPADRAFT_379833 [Schizopora paradoxa]
MSLAFALSGTGDEYIPKRSAVEDDDGDEVDGLNDDYALTRIRLPTLPPCHQARHFLGCLKNDTSLPIFSRRGRFSRSYEVCIRSCSKSLRARWQCRSLAVWALRTSIISQFEAQVQIQ